jgi:hypothetical protein
MDENWIRELHFSSVIMQNCARPRSDVHSLQPTKQAVKYLHQTSCFDDPEHKVEALTLYSFGGWPEEFKRPNPIFHSYIKLRFSTTTSAASWNLLKYVVQNQFVAETMWQFLYFFFFPVFPSTQNHNFQSVLHFFSFFLVFHDGWKFFSPAQ